MQIECPNVIGCAGVDSPISNISSELPDVRTYIKRVFREDHQTVCVSEISQADADLCDPPPNTNPPTIVAYSNTAQSCRVACGDGSFQSYTVGAASFVAFSQALADQQATSFACSMAAILCAGGTVTEYSSLAQTCTMTCADGTRQSYTSPAGLFIGSSQAEADALAYNFACVAASLMCSTPPSGGGTSGDVTGGEQGESITGTGSGTNAPASRIWFANAETTSSANCLLGGTFTFLVPGGIFFRPTRAQANAVAISYGRNQVINNAYCLGSPTLGCCVSSDYFSLLSLSPSATAEWTITSGQLPPGLILSAGYISGVPLLSGTYAFTVRATLTNGSYSERSYSIQAIEVSASLPAGTEDESYGSAVSQTGGTEPVTWSIASGALPAGLSLDSSTGQISGTPTTAGASAFTVQLTDANGYTCSRLTSITIAEAAGFSWDDLIWNAPNIQTLEGGTASASALGPDMASVTTSPAPPPVLLAYGTGSITGNMYNYAGPSVNCNLHVEQTNTAYSDPSNNAVCGCSIYWNDPGLTILINFAVYVSGSYDYPFVIPASTDAQIQITFYGSSTSQFPGGAQACTCSGFLSVIP